MDLRPSRSPRLRGDEGMSLIEVMVATVILGIGVVGLLSGLAFLFTATNRHRDVASANTELSRAMEVVADPKQTPFDASCGAAATYQATARAQVGNDRVNVDAVQVWSGGGWAPCGATPDLPLQQVAIRVAAADGSGDLSMSVVKRGDA
jgi:prepilin-type N-terminal cleavage/methylation domain-containing protein